MTLELLVGLELCGNWFSVTQSKPMQSRIAPGGGAPGNPALGWNRSLTRPAAPQQSPDQGLKITAWGASVSLTAWNREPSLQAPNMEKYVRTSISEPNTTDAAVIRTLKSGLSATYKNNYLETKLNDMSGNVDNGLSDFGGT